MNESNTIYYLEHSNILDKNVLVNDIYLDLNTNYYYSDDFSTQFYIDLAKAGFISTTTVFEDSEYLLPEIQFEYALLDFEDLHISKKVSKLQKANNYIFNININLEEILDKLDEYHEPNWITSKYKNILRDIFYNKPSKNFEINCFDISDKKTNKIIAAEIGYTTNNIYTSLSGFSSNDKEYRNYGKLQLVELASYLQKQNFSFWNLGHPYMQYKFDLGAKVYKRNDFLIRWYS